MGSRQFQSRLYRIKVDRKCIRGPVICDPFIGDDWRDNERAALTIACPVCRFIRTSETRDAGVNRIAPTPNLS